MNDIEKVREYLTLRQKMLSKYVGGLSRSKRKYPKSWTEKDDIIFIKANYKKKEVESIITKLKNIDYYIHQTQKEIERMDGFKIQRGRD